MTKAAQPLGIIAALVAAVLWLMARWVHEVQRRLAEAGVLSAEGHGRRLAGNSDGSPTEDVVSAEVAVPVLTDVVRRLLH